MDTKPNLLSCMGVCISMYVPESEAHVVLSVFVPESQGLMAPLVCVLVSGGHMVLFEQMFKFMNQEMLPGSLDMESENKTQ